MQNNKNNNTSIANQLDLVLQSFSGIDTTDTYNAIANIQFSYEEIETIAQDENAPTLRAIIHWLALNTEVDSSNEAQIKNLLKNDSYSNWIDVLVNLIENNDFSLLPVLHETLTSPDWIVRPSPILLKKVAVWLNEMRVELSNNSTTETSITSESILQNLNSRKVNTQVSNETEEALDLIESELSTGSIDDLILDQIAQAENASNDSFASQNAFEEVNLEDLEKSYSLDDIDIDIVDIVSEIDDVVEDKDDKIENIIDLPDLEQSNLSNNAVENTPLENSALEEANIEPINSDITFSDSKLQTSDNQESFNDDLNEDILAKNELLIESLIESDNNTNLDVQVELIHLKEEFYDIYQKLISISSSSKDIFSSTSKYFAQLDRFNSVTEATSLETASSIATWCQKNIILFTANPSSSIEKFVSSGKSWLWIKELHECLSVPDKKSCITDVTKSLTQTEWLQPIGKNELESLLLNLKTIIDHKDSGNTDLISADNKDDEYSSNEVSLENLDLPQLVDVSTFDEIENEPTIKETSGFQITWDDDTHPELLTVFLEETDNQIDELKSLLLKTSNNEADAEEKKIASRLAHTIKGGSAIVGITALSELSYRLETILDYAIRHPLDSDILALLPNAGKCLESVFAAVQLQGSEPDDYLTIFKTLDEYMSSLEEDEEELEELSAAELPEFILEQNETEDVDAVKSALETSGFQLYWNDDTHPELLMVYLEETPTQIAELVPLLNKISIKTASAEEKHVASRMAHTIKGGSAIVGITVLSEIAYRLETLLDYSVKHTLPKEILDILPQTSVCLENVFEAIQMQGEEPIEYLSIFNTLDNYVDIVNNIVDEEEDEPEALISPTLPDFILNQNENKNKNKNDSDKVHATDQIIPEEIVDTTENNNEIVETVATETVKLEKLNTEEEVKNIHSEMDDIVMHLMSVSATSDDIKTDLDKYTAELERFELFCEISGYPELSLLSQWCQSNLTLFAENNDNTNDFVASGEIWSWIEFVGAALSDPDDISILSSLSIELMRNDWAKAINMDDLQTVLLALREIDKSNVTIDSEFTIEETNTDEVVSWDKDVHPELLAVYFQETPDQINEVAGLLLKISKGESNSEENKKAARIAHTIKGASGVVGLNSLVELTHKLEDILEYSVTNEIEDESSELLAEASDCLEGLFESIQNKEAVPDDLSLVLTKLTDFSTSLGIKQTDFSTVSTLKTESNTGRTDTLSITTLSPDNSSTPNNKGTAEQDNTTVDINEAYIRVPLNIIDKLLNLAGELVTTSSQVSDDLANSLATNKSIKLQDERVNHILGELAGTITQQEKEQHKLLSSLENSKFDSLEMDTYNELQSVASLLSESFLDSQEIDNTLTKQLNGLSDKLRNLDKLNKDFSDLILSSRMISINTIIPRLERIVRQTCRKTGKKAELQVTGNNINIDTDILNGLIDPLLHMLRNSIDHGIESPEDRGKKGKNETGIIALDFTRDGNNIVMSLNDDGAGINPEAIYQKAIEKELITPEQEYSTREMLNLILQPGFTTQQNVTDISGRGVGMDVVNSSVEELNGSLSIDSEIDQGTMFNLTIPLTLITNTTLLVRAANNTVAIPIDTIEQIIYQEENSVIQHGNKYFVVHEGQELEIRSLSHLLEWSNKAVDYSQSSNVLVIKTNNKYHAIHVDSIINSREVVVKPLNPWITSTKGVIGACHLNHGGVAPVINLNTIVAQSKQNAQSINIIANAQNVQEQEERTQKILVVDDSLSNRKALSLIIDKTDYDVVTAVDGMDALQIMNENEIDLVFTDLEMPRMNGIELTQAIRAWNSKSKTPVIMITSRTTNKHRELANNAGVDDYLTKPVVTETLLDSINTWLTKSTEVEV